MKDTDFEKIYNEYADHIFRYCFFRVSNREVAKDLTQETFIRTWNSLEKGKQIENIKAFLYRVATNLVIDYYRKHKEVSLDLLKENGFDFVKEGEETIDFMELQWVLKEMRQLPEKYQKVLTLRYIEDASPGDIAKTVGISENSASVLLHRGVKMLKKKLNLEEYDEER